MRAVVIAQVAPAVQGLRAMLREHGHEPVALMAREDVDRYGEMDDALRGAPVGLDVVIPSSRDRIAPLLRVFEPDVVFCGTFPWKIPAEALAVPRPRYRERPSVAAPALSRAEPRRVGDPER